MPSAVAAARILLDAVGAVILALALIARTPQASIDEATPRWDFNVALDASLAQQTADAQVGAVLLVLGFAAQFVSALGGECASWSAVPIAVGTAAAVAAGAWAFLVSFWRPRRIRAMLGERLRASEQGLWWPALASYGDLLGQPRLGDEETIAAYGERVLGSKRWTAVTQGIALSDVMTKPRSELPGTREYEEKHGTT